MKFVALTFKGDGNKRWGFGRCSFGPEVEALVTGGSTFIEVIPQNSLPITWFCLVRIQQGGASYKL